MKAGVYVESREKQNRKLNQKGMTLVEVVVAMAILAIVVAPTLRIFASTSETNLRSRQRQRATSVAEAAMESLKAYRVEALCTQFMGNSFKGVVKSTDSARPTVMKAVAVYGGVEQSPIRTDGTWRNDADSYKLTAENVVSEGQYYDMEIVLTPSLAPNVLTVEDISTYSDAIITLKEDTASTAQGKLEQKARDTLDTNFASIQPSATSHNITSVTITDFKRVIDVAVNDNGTVQTVKYKVTYTCKAQVNYTYNSSTGSHSGNKAYDETLLKYEEVLDTATGATELTVFDDTATIAGVDVLGRQAKLNHLYLYYFPVYPSQFGSGAKDEINITGTLSSLYSYMSGMDHMDSKARGYDPLQITVAKQIATVLTDVELNSGEVAYNVKLNGAVTGGTVELQTNLTENLSPLGSVISTPAISGFTGEALQDSLLDRVVLLYDAEIHVYEAGTTNEVAQFIGTKNE